MLLAVEIKGNSYHIGDENNRHGTLDCLNDRACRVVRHPEPVAVSSSSKFGSAGPQGLGQLKILTTALFSALLLGRTQGKSGGRLVVLTAGIATVQAPQMHAMVQRCG